MWQNSKTLFIIKLKNKILTKLKKIQVLKKPNFWPKVFWLEQLDTSKTDEMFLVQSFVILQCFTFVSHSKSLCSREIFKKNYICWSSVVSKTFCLFVMQAICSFSVPKTIKTKDMGATLFFMKGFVLNIHNHNQLVATVPRGLTLMVLADSPVSCKSNFGLFAFF